MNYADKLQKLIRHERSARAIGSTAEADRYALKIIELRGKYTDARVFDDDGSKSLKEILAEISARREKAEVKTRANIQRHIAYFRSKAASGNDR